MEHVDLDRLLDDVEQAARKAVGDRVRAVRRTESLIYEVTIDTGNFLLSGTLVLKMDMAYVTRFPAGDAPYRQLLETASELIQEHAETAIQYNIDSGLTMAYREEERDALSSLKASS